MSDSKLAQASVPATITEQAQCLPQTAVSDEQATMNFLLSQDLPDADQQCFILGYN